MMTNYDACCPVIKAELITYLVLLSSSDIYSYINFTYKISYLLQMKLHYDSVCPPVGWLDGLSFGLSVMSKFRKKAGSFTSMVLSEHLLTC